jgi:hypothetical protein
LRNTRRSARPDAAAACIWRLPCKVNGGPIEESRNEESRNAAAAGQRLSFVAKPRSNKLKSGSDAVFLHYDYGIYKTRGNLQSWRESLW